MSDTAILGAVAGVLTGALGAVRTIPADTFLEGIPTGSPKDKARLLIAREKPCFDVELRELPTRTKAVGPSMANLAILRAGVTVTLAMPLTELADVDDPSYKRTVRGTASEYAKQISRALTWNLNLAQDEDTNATNLINGALLEDGPMRVKREDWTAGLYEIELRFRALIQETQAVA